MIGKYGGPEKRTEQNQGGVVPEREVKGPVKVHNRKGKATYHFPLFS
jgi:hypothetical protein